MDVAAITRYLRCSESEHRYEAGISVDKKRALRNAAARNFKVLYKYTFNHFNCKTFIKLF